MDFPGATSFKLFGKLIISAPIHPPDPVNPSLQLQLATPSSSAARDDTDQAIKRLVNELNRKRSPIPADPGLERVLRGVRPSSNPRLTHFFNKNLFECDVTRSFARLTIPRNQILRRFLNDDEERLFQQAHKDSGGRCFGLRVQLIDPKLEVHTLNLTRWNYAERSNSSSRSCSYVLNEGWYKIVEGNGFSKGDAIQVWSFRKIDDSLAFIIFKQ